jgi:gliding motility-associated-like protein
MKLFLLRAVTAWLIFTGVVQHTQAQALVKGDLLFTGFNSFDDDVNGLTQNDAFSFVILRDCPANTIITFTDLGWTGTRFQQLNCPTGEGPQTDGWLRWSSGSTVIRAGTPVVISCKYAPSATLGTIIVKAPTAANVNAYISLGFAGDELFAFIGNINSPTIIAGIKTNSDWDNALGDCEFSSSKSLNPSSTTPNDFPAYNAVNAKFRCVRTIGTAASLRNDILSSFNWLLDNTFSTPAPIAFDVKKSAPCNLRVVNPSAKNIVFVNNQSSTPGDGSSWTSPLPELRDAVEAAADFRNAIFQVWVAKGTYKPTASTDTEISFRIPSDLLLYGGFAGIEDTITARNIPANPVILSGDIDGNDITTGNIVRKASNIRGANTTHVIILAGSSPQTLMDGVIVTGGKAVSGFDVGAGIISTDGSIKIANTQFYGNYSRGGGGAIYTSGNNTVQLTNTVFSGNQSGQQGGAIKSYSTGLSLTNVTIGGNTSLSEGSGIIIPTGTLTVNNSIIAGNTSTNGLTDASFSGGDINYSILGNQYYTSTSTHQNTPAVQYASVATGDLQLTTANFAINHGDPQTNNAGYGVQSGTLDLAGKPRISNTIIDLGAYEYQAKPQTIIFPALATATYGDPDITPAATTDGDAAIIYSSGTITVADTVAGKIKIKGVDTTIITANAGATNGFLPALPVTQTLTVNKKALQIKSNDVSRPYRTANPDAAFTYTGFAYSEDSAKAITGLVKAVYGGDINSPVGTYAITPDLSSTITANYTTSGVNGTLTITQAAQTITFPVVTGKTYGNVPFALSATSTSGLPITYTVTSGPATVSGNTLTITGAGDVTITADQAGNGNYTAAPQVSQTFTVAKAILTVTGNDDSKAYKQPNPTLAYTITGFVNGENVSVVTGTAGISTTADINSPVGTYPIVVTQDILSAANYTFQLVNGNLVVNKTSQTITVPAITTKPYGTPAFGLAGTSTSGLPVTYNVTGPATVNDSILTITGAGSITITATQTGDGNYNAATPVIIAFSVTKALLTLKADDQQRLYGQNNPTLTYTYSGFVTGDNSSVVTGTPLLSTTANINSAPTTYPITFTNAGTLSATNYSIIPVDGTLSVMMAPQTITFPVITDKTYGDAPVTLNATSNSGLTVTYSVVSGPATVNGNTLTITGTGDITIAANQTGDGNHTPATAASQTFNVGKAVLTVTATSYTKIYLQPNPALAYNIIGFTNGDDINVVSNNATINTTADINSVPGAYPITITAGSISAANYSFSFVNSTLTVTPAAQTITFPAITGKTYGDAPFTLSASSDASLPITYSVVSGPATVNGSTLTITGTGNITIAADQAGDGNYTAATQTTQSFTVAKAVLTVTANSKTKIYLLANPALDYTITGFVYNEDNSVVSGNANISTIADINSIPGTYPIAVTTGNISAANYTFSFADNTLTVTLAAQTITFPAISGKTYGDAAFTLGATSDAGLPVTYTVIAGPATINGSTVTITGAGSVTIAANQAGNPNYSAATQTTQTFNVSKAPLTVTANGKTKVYGQANPALDYTITGFVNGEDISVVNNSADINTTADVNSAPGVYPITLAAGSIIAANYDFSFVNGSLTVTKATQTITFPAITGKTYGDAPFALSATSDASLPITYSVISGPATVNGSTLTITGTGNITVAADQAGNGNYTAATQATQSFTVAKALLTVTANSKTKIYLLANPVLDYTITGFVYNEDNSVVSGNANISTVADINSTPGTYPIAVTAGNISAANYTFSFADNTLTVTLAAQTITFPAIAGKTYGDAAFTLGATSDAGLPINYTVTSGPATINGSTVTITGAGSVTIAANQAGNPNYSAATQTTQTFNVSKAPLTVTANGKTKVYGQANPALDYTITGFVNGEDISVVNNSADINTTADVNSAPGVYPITLAAGSIIAANYDFSFVNGSLTVTKATQTITFPAITGKTYGDAPFALSATSDASLPITYSVISGPATVNGSTLTITGTGNITVAADQAGNGNYTAATQATQSFTVAKALLTVTANSKTKIYLLANPVLDYTITGFVYNEDNSVVSGNANISTVADINSTPGTYPIAVTAGNISAANYTFSFADNTLTVTLAAQTITFPAIAGKTYGDAAFTLGATSDAGLPVTYTVTSGPATINGSTVTITGTGSVTIAANQAGNSSYAPATTATQTFTVAKATLTVTATGKTKVYGQANPTLDYLITGLVNGDNSSVVSGNATINTVADINSTPGSYPITVTAGTLSATNYTFSFVNSSLTVTKATQTINFPAITGKTYGDAAFTLNASSNAGLPVTYTVTSGPATINGNTLTITGAGTVTIEATQAGSSSYNAAAPVSNSFVVAKATLTVKADDKQKVAGSNNPALTYTITGFVNGDNSSAVSGTPVLSTTANNSSAAGTYPINPAPGTLNAANYLFTTVNGTLTIGLATQTITFPVISGKTYGDATFALNASSNSGLPITYTVTSGPATINGSTVTITGAGNVTVAANQAGNNSYSPATTATQTFTVAKAILTVTATGKTKVYGQANPTLDYLITGLVNGDNSSVVSGNATINTVADINSTPGSYPITVTAGTLSTTNYTFSFVNSSLTVTKATQTITFPVIAGKTYGDAAFTLNASSNSGLPITYTVTSGPVTINGSTFTITGAGTVTIEATQAGSSSYNAATPVSNSFVVAKATLTVKADDKQQVAGSNNPALTYTITGLVNSDNNSVISGTPVLSTTANNSSAAGTYPITVAAGTLNAANYLFTTVNGTLTVGLNTQTITFPAISGKIYGDAAFTLNASSNSGLPITYMVIAGPATINGSTVTITGAGNVTIAANQAGNGSYSPATRVMQTFAVGKAPLTVKANNDARTYNGTAYTGGNGVSYTGFVNGDDATKLSGSITYSGNAQGAVNAGTYIITPAGLSSSNYVITYIDGQLIITRAAQQIVFNHPGDRNQGDPDFTLTATSNSGLPVTFSSDNAAVISLTGNTAHVGAVGTALITASQAGNNNYEPAATVIQTITVNAFSTPVITAGGSTIFCEGNSVTLQSTTAPGYEWYRNGIRVTGTGSGSLNVNESGDYTVRAVYNNNLSISSAVVTVIVHPLPAGNLQANGNTTISKGETIRLIASGGNTYTWDPSTALDDPNSATPVARPAVTTTYQVTISNLFKCSVTRDITITVKEDYKLEAINILTPNGDGKNDLWLVKNIDMYPQNEVKIYDRAGRLIYQKRGYTNNWNGTLNGQPLAEGTYYYIITLGDNKPQFKGFITIIHEN